MCIEDMCNYIILAFFTSANVTNYRCLKARGSEFRLTLRHNGYIRLSSGIQKCHMSVETDDFSLVQN